MNQITKDINSARLIPGNPKNKADAIEKILSDIVYPKYEQKKLISIKKTSIKIFFAQ